MKAAATFVHIGDCHMGPNARNVDRWRAINEIIAVNVDRADLAAWLIPGDLNHARMTIEDRNAWAQRLLVMGEMAPVVMCYGNHDLPGDLDVFAKLATRWPIYVVATPQVLRVPLGDVDCPRFASIFVLPYPTESGLVSAGVAPGAIVSTAREALDAIFMHAAGELEQARRRGDITMMIGHVNVAGSITSTGQPNVGAEIELDAALLARLGDCYKGLNHIHKAQSIGGAYYPGSICRLDWGEVEPKEYLRIEVRDDGIPVVFHQPLDVAPMYHVEGWLSRDGFTYDVKGGDKPESWRGCEVRARLRYHQSEKGILEFQKAPVFAEFAESSRFELELIAVPDSGLRAPEVAAARTLPEKVEAWAKETSTTLPDMALTVLATLEHGDADVVVANERAAMDLLLNPPAAVEAEQEEQAVA